jgi:hypothetical protein
MSGVVKVNFFDQSNHSAAPRQVLVDDFPIDVAVSGDGTKKFITLLSDLIPAAIQNDSPIKGMSSVMDRCILITFFLERGGRLYRPNVRDEVSHHHIGKIDAVLSGTAKPLFTRLLDEYVLRPADDGGFVCDVFWDMSGASATPQPGALGNEVVGVEVTQVCDVVS